MSLIGKHAMAAFCSFTVVGCVAENARAADVDGLAEFLRPAYTAMNYTVLCTSVHSSFIAATSGTRGTALHYAQHAKDEAISGLTDGEARTVLLQAASSKTALDTLAALKQTDDAATRNAIKHWCANDGRRFVLDFIRHHDATHEMVELFLEDAKQASPRRTEPHPR